MQETGAWRADRRHPPPLRPLPSSTFALPLSAVALSLGAASCSQDARPGPADPLAVEERSVGPGARSQLDLSDFGDDALEQEFLRSVERCRTNAAHEPQVQRCLTEMARRGGERWIEFLSGRMRALQAAHALDQTAVNEQSALVFLTALRRAQRAHEPAKLLLAPDTPRACAASKLPTLSFAIRNVDPEFAFEFSNYDFQRVRAELRTSTGTAVSRKAPPREIGGGPAMSWRLAPGATSSTMGAEGWVYVNLASQFGALDPGDYSVVLSYSPTEVIAFLRDTQGLIVVSSEPFLLRVEDG